MKTENKIYNRIVNEVDYCMSKEYKASKDELQQEIDATIMKTILLVEKQLEEEAERK